MSEFQDDIMNTEEDNRADQIPPEDASGNPPQSTEQAETQPQQAEAQPQQAEAQPQQAAGTPPIGGQPGAQFPYQGAQQPVPPVNQTPYGQYPYQQGYQQAYTGQYPYGQPGYGQPYTPYGAPYGYPPQKKKMATGVKVFLIVLSILGAGSLLGLILATVYAGSTQQLDGYQDFYQQFSDEFGGNLPDEFGWNFDGDESGNGTPPGYSETPQVEERTELEQPDIEFTPYEKGITINSKPSGKELSAQEVYDKVVPSTVSVMAEIPLTQGETESSSGTGIFITSDGFIVTNSHVIGNTKSSLVTITTHDGEEYPAIVVGFDKTTDLAILKTEDHGFTPAEFGDASQLGIGEWVLAIGNPGGTNFTGSLTRGVISGLDRTVGEYSSNGMTYIQTDAAINPGNSGGPLVNMYGQVVGINSSKVAAQYYEGMGFAIPVSKAKDIIDQLLSDGYVEGRTRLGITAQNVIYGEPSGVRIVEMEEGSSFSGTEARVGDIITAVDDTSVESLTDLANKLLDYKPGDQVKISLYRPDTGEELEVTATLLADNGETQK